MQRVRERAMTELFTIGVADMIAEAEAAAVVVVDHLDILAPQDRGRAIKLLAQLGIASVVACTAKDAGALPDLAAMKIGRTIWLEDGTAVEPAKQAA